MRHCLLPKPLRLVPISHNPSVGHCVWQHGLVFQPVDIARSCCVRADILAPCVVGVSADAMNCNDTAKTISRMAFIRVKETHSTRDVGSASALFLAGS